MGQINRGILGGFSGKVANIIGGSWKGIAYMRSQPVSVANPNTPGQQAQREKFSTVVELAVKYLNGIVKPLNDRFAVRQSGFNLFVSRNIHAFDNNGDFLPGTGLEIARGNLLLPANLAVSGTNASTSVDITWDDNSGGSTVRQSDLLYAICINDTKSESAILSIPVARSVETATITMPGPVDSSDELYLYVAFRALDGSEVSNTDSATDTVS